MKKAVVFGAGNIGRGFVGQLFCESGYSVTFVDIDDELLSAINAKGSYRLQTVFNDEVNDYRIGPASGINANHVEAVAEAVAEADLASTSVGARALTFVAPNLARGLVLRFAAGSAPLDIILCENLKNAAAIVRDMVAAHLPEVLHARHNELVGYVDTVIGRMVPPPTPEMRDQDPSFIRVEPYKELPVDKAGFKGEIPKIVGMEAHDNFQVFTARKLYIHNCGHALLAYMGWIHGFEYGYEALADSRIREFLFGGWQESANAINARYGADLDWLKAHMEDLYLRFQNRALGDTVVRLGRDPVRKLGPTDRLVAPARLAAETGSVPQILSTGIAAALCFDPPGDPVARELQERLAAEGPAPILRDICQIDPRSSLGQTIIGKYQELKRRAQP